MSNELSKRRRARRRRAVAELEIALAIPLLALFITMFFLVSNVVVTRVATVVQARQAAFASRHRSTDGTLKRKPRTEPIAEMESIREPLEQRRIVRAGAEEFSLGAQTNDARPMFRLYENLLPSTSSQTQVLAGAWDFRQMEFEKHPQLHLTEWALPFGLDRSDLTAFERLAGNGGSGTAGLAGVRRSTKQASKQVARELQETEATIKRIQETIVQMRAQNPIDEVAIARLRDELASAQEKFAALTQASNVLDVKLPLFVGGPTDAE